MSKCLIAQSGGPTSVINTTIAGIVQANQENPFYDTVLGSLNGVEGIFAEQFVDLTNMTEEENLILRQTPGSALGSCRYKLKKTNEEDIAKIFEVFEKNDIDTLFFIGGNDSMSTVMMLNDYADRHNHQNCHIIGIPKTIDNDMMETDHSLGFGSAAKFIATTALQTWLDLHVYPPTRKEVFVLETMGRDAGWLASSACLSGIVDLLIVPEEAFDKEIFLREVKNCIEAKSKCYVVVSEGAHYEDGTYLRAKEAKSDKFGHAVLGGAGKAIEEIILDSGVCSRVRVQNLATAQRCHGTEASLTDATEAFEVGKYAHAHSKDEFINGKMIAIKRIQQDPYEIEYTTVDAEDVANYVNNFPEEWLLPNFRGVTGKAIAYLRPLIQGTPEIILDEGIPAYIMPFYLE